jgi:hypothetical protein
VFACLQEAIGKPDFGANCQAEVEKRTSAMQEDYRLDFGVASKCEAAVNTLCLTEKVTVISLLGAMVSRITAGSWSTKARCNISSF